MSTPQNKQTESLADGFFTALTLAVPVHGSTGRLSNSDVGSDSSRSSRGGSETVLPKISIMSLGDAEGPSGNDARTVGDSRSAASHEEARSASGS